MRENFIKKPDAVQEVIRNGTQKQRVAMGRKGGEHAAALRQERLHRTQEDANEIIEDLKDANLVDPDTGELLAGSEETVSEEDYRKAIKAMRDRMRRLDNRG